MRKNTESRRDRSPVSLTGRFTGQVWVENQLSPRTFSTRSGEWMVRLIKPLDRFISRVQGISLETMLLQRHSLIDRILLDAVRAQPDLQVVEIACGVSGRAVRILARAEAKDINYIEADLPDVVDHKMEIYRTIGFKDRRHQLRACNILRPDGNLSLPSLFEQLDTRRPVLVINEGLVNYFEFATMEYYWRRLSGILSGFPNAAYVADIWPRLPDYKGLQARRWAIKGIETLTRQTVPLHFNQDADMAAAFESYGFTRVQVLDPDQEHLPESVPTMKRPTLFRVLFAELGGTQH